MSHLMVALFAWLLAYQVWKNWRLREKIRVLEYLLDLERQLRDNKPPTGAEKGEQE